MCPACGTLGVMAIAGVVSAAGLLTSWAAGGALGNNNPISHAKRP
jgi:hypothetical protein